MSFSVSCEHTGIEYNGASLHTLFARRQNVISLRFFQMLVDILRFNRESTRILADSSDLTLGEYLHSNRYSDAFRDLYILPMGSAIWSAPLDGMLRFPLRFFVAFMKNHGMLSINDRPQWRTIVGGSQAYIQPLSAPFRDSIRLSSRVLSIRRFADRVEVTWPGGTESFDHVVLACHADQSLKLLSDPSPEELEVLGAMPFQENLAILHTDERLMPSRRAVWASWNSHVPRTRGDSVAVTYNMNILQGLKSSTQYLVTLNHVQAIREERIIKRIVYHHPQYTLAGVKARERWSQISGPRRTHYCGAYWLNGFHEDGVASSMRVASHIDGPQAGAAG
jgi:predicted NAD/FAD-binding protein